MGCRPKKSTSDRFWEKVDRSGDGCWEWQAGTRHDGYGEFWLGGRMPAAHRVAYILTYGPIPAGTVVCHRCDNPLCCRPDHLFLGTTADNVRDMLAKGRGNRTSYRLTPEQREEIRHRYVSEQVSVRTLAAEYGITPPAVRYLVHTKQRTEQQKAA